MSHSSFWTCSKQVSWRTRMLVISDWTRRFFFGRDSSQIWSHLLWSTYTERWWKVLSEHLFQFWFTLWLIDWFRGSTSVAINCYHFCTISSPDMPIFVCYHCRLRAKILMGNFISMLIELWQSRSTFASWTGHFLLLIGLSIFSSTL